MNKELKSLLKGKWKYNLTDNKILCKNNKGLTYIFENKDNHFFQDILSTLHNRGTPTPDLTITYEKPLVPVPLDLFHRIMRSNEVIYEQTVGLRETREGLYCFSDHTKHYPLNHHEYTDGIEVYVDPQEICKITRRIKDRERVNTRIKLTNRKIILECAFPWTVLTIILPTLQR